MKLKSLALIAASTTAMFVAGSANASIFISYALNGGGITYTGVTGTTAATYTGNVGSFLVNAASGSTGTLPYLLNSSLQADKTGGAASTLDIYVTATDQASLSAILTSTFTENVLPTGWTVTESTYYDLSNNDLTGGVFTGTLLSSAALTGLSAVADPVGPLSLPGLFSITHRYHIVAPAGRGSSLSTISLSAASAVPEPASWALMLGGFGLLGLTLRSRAARFKLDYVD